MRQTERQQKQMKKQHNNPDEQMNKWSKPYYYKISASKKAHQFLLLVTTGEH
jgi:hypothetical protein